MRMHLGIYSRLIKRKQEKYYLPSLNDSEEYDSISIHFSLKRCQRCLKNSDLSDIEKLWKMDDYKNS